MADVITLITEDHRTIEKLFDRLKREPKRRQETLGEVAALLTAHNRAEEDKVYPVAAKEAGEREEARNSAEEHHEAETLLQRLRKLPPDGKQFDSTLTELVEAVLHHVREEESEVLPALRKAVTKKRLTELGTAFSERREQELSAFAAGGKKGGGPSAADASKDELYEEAQRLDIPGRSKMNKDDLATEVQRRRSA